MGNKYSKNCLYCGKEFYVSKPCVFKKRKYCSQECAARCPIHRAALGVGGKKSKGRTLTKEQKLKISKTLIDRHVRQGTDKGSKNVVVCNKWNSLTEKNILDITYNDLEKYRKEHLVCEICGKRETSRAKNQFVKDGKVIALTVDHDHSTNKFRGLLCRRCNRALGWYEKYQDGLSSYLNKGETTLG